jgi:2-polyprenyl-3-methyl-5-hydroxy-6-metoxy-1,4-benzoquinol methylase
MANQPRSIYKRAYYERWFLDEHRPYHQGQLRREDMLVSVILACLPQERISRMTDWTDLETDFDLSQLADPREVPGILNVPGTRPPRQVLDVGCGRGELVAAFNNICVPVLGIDTSASAIEYSEQTIANPDWCASRAPTTRLQKAGLRELDQGLLEEPIDCLVFLESLEHIERSVVREFFKEVLAQPSPFVAPDCRVIISNIWFPVWDFPDHLWGVGNAPFSGEENRRLGRKYWWSEYDLLRDLGRLTELFRSPTNPTVIFERAV